MLGTPAELDRFLAKVRQQILHQLEANHRLRLRQSRCGRSLGRSVSDTEHGIFQLATVAVALLPPSGPARDRCCEEPFVFLRHRCERGRAEDDVYAGHIHDPGSSFTAHGLAHRFESSLPPGLRMGSSLGLLAGPDHIIGNDIQIGNHSVATWRYLPWRRVFDETAGIALWHREGILQRSWIGSVDMEIDMHLLLSFVAPDMLRGQVHFTPRADGGRTRCRCPNNWAVEKARHAVAPGESAARVKTSSRTQHDGAIASLKKR